VRRNRNKISSACDAVLEALEGRVLLSVGLLSADQDIGAPGQAGSAAYANGIYTVAGGGAGIAGKSDQFNFAYSTLTDGGTVSALVDSQSSANPAAAAGVMIRNDTTVSASFASLNETTQNGLLFQWRSSIGAAAQSASLPGITGPAWLELTQQGANVSAFYSLNDINWTQVGSAQAITFSFAAALAGVNVTSSDNTSLNTATFSNVNITQSGFTDSDIGSPSLPGAVVYDTPSGTDTIFGSGSGIGGNADQFNFASTSMNGDGSVLAYINSITSSSITAQAGVMVRNDQTAGSPFVAVLVSITNGITFEWRSAENGPEAGRLITLGSGTLAPPLGVKLTRSGNTFTGYYSTDGVNWIATGASQTVPLQASALAGIAVTSGSNGISATAAISSVGTGASPPPGAGIYSSTDQLFLNNLEESEFNYFYDEANANTGLVPDNGSANGGGDSADASIAATGFGLSALTIGDARGWVSHLNAYDRALTTVTFLYNSGAGMDGYFYHFLYPATGQRYPDSELSSVDTAELMAGVLTVAQYWAGTPVQTEALKLYDRVNWPFMEISSGGQFYGAWYPAPDGGFSGDYGDFSEAALLYLLAAGSPTYPTTAASWDSWSRTPVVNYDGYSFVSADDGALFTEQYPQAWFDLQGMVDNTGLNFYANSQTATLAQRQMFINLSSTYSDYNANFWGLTASEGPDGYTVWGGPPPTSNIDGSVAPTAAGGSLEFTPRLSLDELEYMYQQYGSTVYQKYGFVDAFNPLTGWTSNLVLGIDVGMTLIAAENSRSDLVWNTFMGNTAAQQATAVAGFHPVADQANYTVTTLADPTGATGTMDLRQAITDADNAGGNQVIDFAYGLSGVLNLTSSLPNITSNLTLIGPAGGTLTINGVGSGNVLTFNSSGTATIQNLNVTGGGVDSLGSLTIAGAVSIPQIFGTGQLTIGTSSSDATLQLTSNGGSNQLNSLTISTGSTLNIGNDTLYINYGSTSDPIAAIASYLAAGYSGGNWNGAGIDSSSVASINAGQSALIYSIGYADGADGIVTNLSFGQIEIMPTLAGDAKLQGNVVFGDFQLLSQYFGLSGGWDEGNFTYGSVVNFGDFQLLSQNFGANSSLSAAAAPGNSVAYQTNAAIAGTAEPAVVNTYNPPASGISTVVLADSATDTLFGNQSVDQLLI
jgi:hypothetical protein